MSTSTMSTGSNSRANVSTRTHRRSHNNSNLTTDSNETLLLNPAGARNLPLPSSFVDNHTSFRSSHSGFTTPKSEMPVPVFHVQSRVPQSFDGYRTRSMEALLIKDLLFIFQGIDGFVLKAKDDKYEIYSKEFVNPCVRQEALRLCSLGTYFKTVKKFVDQSSVGIILHGLKHGLRDELREYYRTVALMHKAVGSGTSSADTPLTDEENNKLDEPTLPTLTVWTWDLKRRLRFLSLVVANCDKKKGGELCSGVFPHCESGCPIVSSMAVSLLAVICKPLYSMICEWILYGELEDPFDEFFIAADSRVRKDELWHCKYRMREKMLPEFIPKKLASRILATGKNINFLKEICHNSAAYKGRDDIEQILKSTPVECLFLKNDPILHNAIDNAYATTSSMVLSVLMEQNRLVDHLQAIKKYLLLGQGDFIRYLLELIQFELSKPAAKVFYHNLSSILESAVRSTNAQFEDEEILSRLDVRLLSANEKEVGWDVFCLDYKVQGPIGTVLTEKAMEKYHQLFNTLWRIKRVESILSTLWKNQASLFKLQRVLPELASVLHRSQLLISEMIHFVHQTQYYIMFEATECAWEQLMADVSKSGDLDEVIAAHESFLETIMSRSLLITSHRELLAQLRGIFNLVHTFKDCLTKFDAAVMNEYERRKSIKPNAAEHLREAQLQFFKKIVAHAKADVETYYLSHQDLVRDFLLTLNRQQDINLQCLSFRLDFNEYYQQTDERLKQPLTFQHRRLSIRGNPLTSAMEYSILGSSMEGSFGSFNKTIPEDAHEEFAARFSAR